jgi:hypothetical protein
MKTTFYSLAFTLRTLVFCLVIIKFQILSPNLNAQITKQWDKVLGGTLNEMAVEAIPDGSGNILALAVSSSDVSSTKSLPSFGSDDYWLLSIDPAGNILDQRVFGGTNSDIPYGIFPLQAGGYCVYGHSNSGANGNKTVVSPGSWIVFLDANLNIVNQLAFPLAQPQMIQLDDGNLLLAGTDNFNDLFVHKMDVSGNVLWTNVEDIVGNLITESIMEFESGDIFLLNSFKPLAINASNYFGEYDYELRKFDASGNLLWKEYYGGEGVDIAMNLLELDNGKLLLVGESLSGISGNKTIGKVGLRRYLERGS